MKKHNALKESRQGWENFTHFIKWGTIICAAIVAFVLVFVY